MGGTTRWVSFLLCIALATALGAGEVQVELLKPTGTTTVKQFASTAIRARITEDGHPLTGASVYLTAVVVTPSGSKERVSLWDDGSADHGDAAAGDGVYCNQFLSTTTPGMYRIPKIKSKANEVEKWQEVAGAFEVTPADEAPLGVRVSNPHFDELGAVEFTVEVRSTFGGAAQTATVATGSGKGTLAPDRMVIPPSGSARATGSYTATEVKSLASGGFLKDTIIATSDLTRKTVEEPLQFELPPPPVPPWKTWLIRLGIPVALLLVLALVGWAIWRARQGFVFHGVMKTTASGGADPPSPAELYLTPRNRKKQLLLGNHPRADIKLPSLPQDKVWTVKSVKEGQKRLGQVVCPEAAGVATKVDGIETTRGRAFDAKSEAVIEIGDYTIEFSQFG